MVAGRPIRFSVSPVSRTSRRASRSATRLETVALFSPVAAAMSAREHGAWARTYRNTTARLVARTSAKSTGWGGMSVVIDVRPAPDALGWLLWLWTHHAALPC